MDWLEDRTLLAAAGDPDSAFADNGVKIEGFGSGSTNAVDVAVLDDGSILAAAIYDNGTNRDFAVAKYQPDGEIDRTFGNGDGLARADFNADDIPTSLAVQADGKIVVGGYVQIGSDFGFGLTRFLTNGQRDTSFGVNGFSLKDISQSQHDYLFDLALGPDDSIIAAGRQFNDWWGYETVVAKFSRDGFTDTDFGTNGVVSHRFDDRSAEGRAVDVNDAGEIIVAGLSHGFPSWRRNPDLVLTKLTGTGSVTFARRVSLNPGNVHIASNRDSPNAVQFLDNGDVVVVGTTQFDTFGGGHEPVDFMISRFNSGGILQDWEWTRFGDASWSESAADFVVDEQGRYIVAGSVNDGNGSDFALVRYKPDLEPDETFGNGGRKRIPLSTAGDSAAAVALQSSERAIAAGSATVDGVGKLAMAGVRTEPTPFGVTVITHGWQLGFPELGAFADLPFWTAEMAAAIGRRAGEARIYFHDREFSGGNSWTTTPRIDDPSEWTDLWPGNSQNPNSEVILVYDWVHESDDVVGESEGGWLQAAADSLFASIINPPSEIGESGEEFIRRSFHYIGHSRGAVLNLETVNRIYTHNSDINIDQFTSLDPHPWTHAMDPGHDTLNLQIPTNVIWADNYYRRDGSYEADLDFDGVIAVGARNLELRNDTLDKFEIELSLDPELGGPFEHSDVHLWYTATIDPSAVELQGEDLANEVSEGWWTAGTGWQNTNAGSGEPDSGRANVGYAYSRLGGKDRPLAGQDERVIPDADPIFFNGDFEYGDAGSDEIPGWERHGGDVDADLVADGRVLVGRKLDGTFRTTLRHNPIYIPTSVDVISFEFEVTDTSGDDFLEVYVGNELLKTLPLSTMLTDTAAVPLPFAHLGRVNTIEFRLRAESGVDSSVLLDDVTLDVAQPDIHLTHAGLASADQIRYTLTTTAVGTSFDVSFFLSSDDTLDASDQLIGSAESVTPTGGTQTRIFSPGQTIPVDERTPYVIAVADSGDDVAETDEGNNTSTLTGIGIDRWFATVGDNPIPVTWTVAVAETKNYTLDVDVENWNSWNLASGASVTVNGVRGNVLNSALGTVGIGILNPGIHQITIDAFAVPDTPVVEGITLQLCDGFCDLFETIVEISTLFVADHPEQFLDTGSEFQVAGIQDSVDLNGLIQAFAPRIHFSDNPEDENGPDHEQYAVPMNVLADQLTGGGGASIPFRPDAAGDRGSTGRDGFIDLAAWSSGEYLPGDDRTTPAIYASVLQNPANANQLAINYYFFFPRSNWADFGGTNTHEGDWEGLTLFLERGGGLWTPVEVGFSQHVRSLEGVGAQTDGLDRLAWSQLYVTDREPEQGTHPHFFAGLGGHAMYAAPGTTAWLFNTTDEIHRGDGTSAAPDELIALEYVPEASELHYLPRAGYDGDSPNLNWLRYPGRWGKWDTGVGSGNDGPRGPVFQAFEFLSGPLQHGQRWLDPWEWLAEFVDNNDGAQPVADSAPPSATIDAAIDGFLELPVDHIEVTYFDDGASGLFHATITDSDPEFRLSGAAGNSAVIDGSPTLISVVADHYTYRYSLQSPIGPGEIEVDFIPDSWTDRAGNGNNLIDVIGPSAIAHAPLGRVFDDVTKVEVVFDEDIDPASVSIADLVSFEGPTFSVDVLSVEPSSTDPSRRVEINIARQDALGQYTFVIGPGILDESGNPMGSTYTGMFTIDDISAVPAPDIRWINPLGGSWHDKDNWNLDRVPDQGDTVLISGVDDGFQVSYSTDITELDNLIVQAPLRIAGGLLEVDNIIDVSDRLQLAGGTIADAIIVGSAIDVTGSITLDNVRLDADTTIGHSRTITVFNDLVLNGELLMAGRFADFQDRQSRLDFSGTQTLSGTGSIRFSVAGTKTVHNLIRPLLPDTVLTIGPDILIHGGYGTLGDSGRSVVVQGTVSADVAGDTIQIAGTDWSSSGLLEAKGGTLLPTGTWTSTGAVRADGSLVQFGGTYSIPGTVAMVNGGTVESFGTLENAGNSLSLDTSDGRFELRGRVNGGALAGPAGSRLVVSSSILDGVTLNVDGEIGHSRTITVFNDLVLNGELLMAGRFADFQDRQSRLDFSGTQTLSGTGSIRFSVAGTKTVHNLIRPLLPDTVLTIGPDILIHGGYGTLGDSGRSVVVQGTVSADVAGDTIQIAGTDWSSSGLLEAKGGTLLPTGTWTSTGAVRADGSLVQFGGTYSIPGTVAMVNGGTVESFGTLENAGNSLSLDTSDGRFELRGRVNGGALAGPAGSRLVVSSSILDGVTLNVDGEIGHSRTITVFNDLVLNGELLMAGRFADFQDRQSRLDFSGTQTLSGTGSIRFSVAGTKTVHNLIRPLLPDTVLTIGPDILIHGGYGTLGDSGRSVVVQGTVSADVAGDTIQIAGTDWSSSGLLEAKGGTLLPTGTWTSTGAVRADGSLVQFGGTYSIPGTVAMVNGGTVESFGTLENAGNSLSLDTSDGRFELRGRVNGGALAGPAGSRLVVSSSILDGVTLNVDGEIGHSRTITVFNDLVLNGELLMAGRFADFQDRQSRLDFSGTQTLSGTGSIRFSVAGTKTVHNLIRPLLPDTVLTIGPDILIHGGYGTLGDSGRSVVVQGTVSADVAGDTIQIAGTDWSSSGLLEAKGGTLLPTGTWTSTGAVRADGSLVQFGGTYSIPGTVAMVNGGTVESFGTLENAGNSLSLDTSDGRFELRGRVNGGALAGPAGSRLVVSSSILDGVTLNVDGEIGHSRTITVFNDLVLNGELLMAGRFADFQDRQSRLDFSGTQTLSGTGSIRFSVAGTKTVHNLIRPLLPDTVLTIGPDILIHGGYGTLGDSGRSVVVQGTVSADVAGDTIQIAGTDWSSSGLLEAKGGTLLPTGTWTSTGAVRADGSLVQFGGTYSIPGTVAMVNGGTIQSSSRISIGPGRLIGVGNVNANLRNNGTITPGSEFGTIVVNGSFEQAAGGNLAVEIESTAVFDSLAVNGDVSLAGDLFVGFEPTVSLPIGAELQIVSNDGADAVTGEFFGLPEGAAFLSAPFVFEITYQGGTGNDVVLTVLDDDLLELIVSESDGDTIVDESGSTDTFGVSLPARPVHNVVLTVDTADPGEATVDTPTLTFTESNWHLPQVVTVTGANDPDVDGDQTTAITVSVDRDTSDSGFHGLQDYVVHVTTTDDDVAAGLDFGDAPAPYPVTLAENGPRHTATGPMLGSNRDAEADGVHSADAGADGTTGDDGTGTPDEDGVTVFPSLSVDNTTYSLTVDVSNMTGSDANLVGWIDFDGSSSFDADEAATATVANNQLFATLTWIAIGGSGPDIVAGDTYVRLRLTTDVITSADVGGAAADGEVEDYAITIETSSDVTPPVVTVNPQTTTDTTPVLTGTVNDDSATIRVAIGGDTYAATNNGDGTWTLPDNSVAELSAGIHNVAVTATDRAGNDGTDGTTNELQIAIFALDFGAALSPVEAGFTQVLTSSVIPASPAAGDFGWAANSGLSDRDRSNVASDRDRDYHKSGNPSALFQAVLPDGEYRVTIVIGSGADPRHNVGVLLEGTQVATVTTGRGQFDTQTHLVSVSDGMLDLQLLKLGSSAIGINAVVIIPATLEPRLDASDSTLFYRLGDDPVAIDAGLLLSDPDDAHLAGAEVRIVGGFVSGEDVLGFSDRNDITGSFHAPSGVLTLSGVDSLANYQAALRSVTFRSTGSTPGLRGVQFAAIDGTTGTGFDTRVINVIPAGSASLKFDFNAPDSPTEAGFIPVLVGQHFNSTSGFGWLPDAVTNRLAARDRGAPTAAEQDYHKIGSGSMTFAVNLPDGTYDVTVTIGSNVDPRDRVGVFVEGIQVDTVSTGPGRFSTRKHRATVSDGRLEVTLQRQGATGVGLNALQITEVTGAPGIDLSDQAAVLVVGEGPILIDDGLTVDDIDSANLVGATVRIVGGFDAATDSLLYSDQFGITGNYAVATGVLTLSGTSAVGNYQTALRTVRFSTTATSGARSIEVVVDDGVETGADTRDVIISAPFSGRVSYDFGTTTSNVEPGFIGVNETSVFEPALGHGFLSTAGITSRNRNAPVPFDERRDYVKTGSGSMIFAVSLPDGKYDVRITMGSSENFRHNVGVILEGTQVDTISTTVNQFAMPTYRVTVNDNRLEVELERQGASAASINALVITEVP